MDRSLSERVKEKVLLYDGSKGVMLQKIGLGGSESAESYNILHPDFVRGIYEAYINAGSDLIQTNTFQANRVSLKKHGLDGEFSKITELGVKMAIEAAKNENKVAVSAGPTSRFFEPLGEMSFENAVSVFAEQSKASEDAGAKIINFETFTDLTELRAAVIGARENTKLEIIANATFDENRKTLMGNPPEACAVTLKALGAAVVGANCSGGPESLIKPIKAMYNSVGGPLCVKPNAGVPDIVNGDTVFSETADSFIKFMPEFIKNGVRIIGGCCGTTPEHIAAMRRSLDCAGIDKYEDTAPKALISSPFEVLELNEKINLRKLDFGDGTLSDAFLSGDFDSVNDYALGKAEGAECVIIDLSGLPEDGPDYWGLASNLVMALRQPVILRGGAAAVRFLRYYTGRCGYIARNDELKERSLFYGALILDENLRPL
ncbi:MAG: homocysteine S-methyltransferase family protein [Bacillota bacterium]|nr:homocysteine S-methyltransferase family protein [Bacillota bacterium]